MLRIYFSVQFSAKALFGNFDTDSLFIHDYFQSFHVPFTLNESERKFDDTNRFHTHMHYNK